MFTATTIALSVLFAGPSAAAAAIRIDRVQYDSPGADTRSNTSLNAEWVRIKNTGNKAKSLKGWRLRDRTGYTYNFGAYTIAAGKTVTLHTGKGSNTTRHRYWGMGNYVWNNDGDKAILRNTRGRTVHTCSWKGGGTAVRC